MAFPLVPYWSAASAHRVPEQLLPAFLEDAVLVIGQVAILVSVEAADREHDGAPLDAAQRKQRLHELRYGQPSLKAATHERCKKRSQQHDEHQGETAAKALGWRGRGHEAQQLRARELARF